LKQIILGTAGHIDHGKTSLIKAITGVNTDRLKEEQIRGITIELGFAALDLPSGQRMGIVDVPGHEKFVKNMVAGATGIDILAMVIAADEGVMPQTREHMEICTLLGIKHGLVVLTKVDMVDEEWLELVTDDVSGFMNGTFLEDAPIIPVSSTTGEGIPDFIKTLDQLCTEIPHRQSGGLFRLPVDRVFTIKGFGTVITGTLISGKVRVGDTITIYPSGVTSKVRGVQVHNETAEEARDGMRTAINFQGLEKTAINRGEVLSTPGALVSGYMVDGSLNYLASNKKPLKNRARVRFHTGTSEEIGIVILLDREELLPGETSVVQIRLDAPVALVKEDRFVLRSYSPVRTIGGGQVLNPIPAKHKRFKPDIIEGLNHLLEAPPEVVVDFHLKQSEYMGVSFASLKIMTNLSEKHLDEAMKGHLSKRTAITVDRENRIYIHGDSFEKLKSESYEHLKRYHAENSLKPGMPKEELKSKFRSGLNPKLLNLLMNQMVKDKTIIPEEEMVRLASHKVSLGIDQSDIKTKILEAYQENGLAPPYFKELGKNFHIDAGKAKAILHLLVDEGLLIKVKEDLYFDIQSVETLKNELVDFLKKEDEITTPRFKEMAGVSRKFVIPLIEYFDSKNVTIRVGDIRKLRGG
jgi:selenocysteine-specific elongation factor